MDYARAIYLIGRSHRQLAYDDSERAEIISFILFMMSIRKEVRQVVRFENYNGTFAMQSDVCLGKNLQRICKFIKYRPLKIEEQTVCDKLFLCLWHGRTNNSYSQEVIKGILDIKVSGLETGSLNVIINGIINHDQSIEPPPSSSSETQEEFGNLNVNIYGIETGLLNIVVSGF